MGYVYVVFVVFVTALFVVRWVQHSQEKANAIRAVENAVWQHGLAFTSPHDAATVTVAGEGVVGTGATEYRLGSASPADARELGRVARLDCMLAVPDVIVCARAIAPAVFGGDCLAKCTKALAPSDDRSSTRACDARRAHRGTRKGAGRTGRGAREAAHRAQAEGRSARRLETRPSLATWRQEGSALHRFSAAQARARTRCGPRRLQPPCASPR
jgi:hypothetical protein